MPAITAWGSILLAEEVRTIDALSANAWPPITTPYLDGWQLRYSPGVTDRRANSVLTLSSGLGDGFSGPIKGVERFYGDRDLPSRFMVSPVSLPEGLDQELADQCYLIEAPTLIQCADLVDVLRLCGPIDGVELIGKPKNSWLAVYMEGIEDQHEIWSKKI